MRAAPADVGDDAVDPRDLVLYKRENFVVRARVTPYDERRTIDWTRGRWLESGETVWVPSLLAHFGFDPGWEERFCVSTSNALAAGVDAQSAERAAVLELVERDAFMITWLARLPGMRLLLDESCEPGVLETVRRMESLGAEIELYSLDVGLSTPVVTCIALGDGVEWPGIVVGCGAGRTFADAARRAVLDTGKLGPPLRRLLHRAGAALPATPRRDPVEHAVYYLPAVRRGAFDFLRRPAASAVPIARAPSPPRLTWKEWAARARNAGVRIAVADVTSPLLDGTPWRVVRALGTHAQPLDFGMRYQRLANPRLERFLNGAEPNPDPHPLA